MPFMFFGNYPLVDLLNAVTGWGIDVAEALHGGSHPNAAELQPARGGHGQQVRLPGRMAGNRHRRPDRSPA